MTGISLILVLFFAIIMACITAGHYEQGKPRTTAVLAVITGILFAIYMMGIQS